MPPKGNEANNKGGTHNKQNVKIKKPSLQSPSNSKGRGNARGGIKGNNRGGVRGNRPIIDEEDNSSDLNASIESTISNPQEDNQWLSKLSPVIKADEELHKKLLKERKEREEKKHFDICRSELRAMLNVALTEVDLLPKDRNEFLTKTRVEFFNGKYHDTVKSAPRTPKANKSKSDSLPSMSNKNEFDVNGIILDFVQLKKSIKQLLDSESISAEDAMKTFTMQTCKSPSQFDANPEMNKIFSLIHHEMQPYIDQDNPIELLNFPFLICIVGPPCSGKSTICQYIASHFDVHIISITNPDSINNNKASLSSSITPTALSKTETSPNSQVNSNDNSFIDKEDISVNSIKSPFVICSSDDKTIINSIIAEISNLPENKGVIITNYPDTKNQLTQLEKALQAVMKKKGDGKFYTINGIIRASMTAEEAARQVQKRLIDKSTGFVFHSTFNPPNSSPNSKFNAEPYPYQITSNINSTRNLPLTSKAGSNKNLKNSIINNNNEANNNNVSNPIMEAYTDLIGVYSKVTPQLAAFDSIMKKIGPTASIGFCNSIGQLNLLIEAFLKAVYKFKNIEAPFTSFVVFETQDQFYYSKLCYNIFQIWNKECIPHFIKQIDSLNNRLKYLKSKIDHLSDISMQMFSLIISRQDDRKERTNEFIRSQNEIRNKIREIQLIKAEKKVKERAKQSSQLNNDINSINSLRPRANTCLATRGQNTILKRSLNASPIKKKNDKAIMTIRTRNLYLRNVFPNVNIDDLTNNRNINLKMPESMNFKQKSNKTIKFRNSRPLTAISDIHKNLNLNNIYNSDISKIDTDKEIKKEEENLLELQINFYHFIWQKSIELRERNTQIVDRFVRRSPIKALKGIMEENEKIVFDALIKRFFLVDWFSTNLSPLLEKKEVNKDDQNKNTIINKINAKVNYRLNSKLNLLSENIFLECDNNSNNTSPYNIDEFPHPTIPDYNITNLKELCLLTHIEYRDFDDNKNDINLNDDLRSIKSTEVLSSQYREQNLNIDVTAGNDRNNSEDGLLSYDSNSLAYLMTPTNRINNISKTPTTSNNVWFPNSVSSVPISSCRNSENPMSHIIDKGKKKLYFPPVISFDHTSSSLHSSSISGLLSSRTVRTNSETIDNNDDDSEVNYYSNESYYQEMEEEEEKENDQKTLNQPYFPFHFPEWRKCNRLNRQNPVNEDLSSSSSINIQIDSKAKTKNKHKLKVNPNKVNGQKEIEKVDSNENKRENDLHQHQISSRNLSGRYHHRHISKEEAIKNFLIYLQMETNDRILKTEAGVMQDLFVHFLEEKALVDTKIDNELKALRENLKNMIHKKCAKEMETFSQRFRSYKDRVDEQIMQSHKQFDEYKSVMINEETAEQSNINNKSVTDGFDFDIDNLSSDDLFPIDTSFMTERNVEIFNALDSLIDNENENVDINKLKKLFSYYFNKCLEQIKNDDNDSIEEKKNENIENEKEENNKGNVDGDDNDEIVDDLDYFVSINDLYDSMNMFEFTQKEKIFVEANVRMKTIPEFINILCFIRSLLPKDVDLDTLGELATNSQNSKFNTAKNSNSALPDIGSS